MAIDNQEDINYFKEPISGKTAEEAFKNRLTSILESHETEINLKLDKGTYTGTAQNLKDDIDLKQSIHDINLITISKDIVPAINEIKTSLDYLDSKTGSQISFDTISEAQAYDKFQEGDRVKVLGYYSKNDGAGHERIFKTSSENLSLPVASGGHLCILDLYEKINILHVGCKANDSNFENGYLIQNVFDTLKPVHIPNANNLPFYYSIPLNLKSDLTSDGRLIFTGTTGIAFNVNTAGFGVKRVVENLKVELQGVRLANTRGIVVDCENAILRNCSAKRFDIGIQPRSYGITLDCCNGQLNNTNLSAYSPTLNTEINDLNIFGGNYDSGFEYSVFIGDSRFSSDITAGNPQGSGIFLYGCNFDGAMARFDNAFNVNLINCYAETSNTNYLVQIGGDGDNYVNGFMAENCFLKNSKYAFYAPNSVRGLKIKKNYYTQLLCGLYYLKTQTRPFYYEKGESTDGFQAKEVMTGFLNGSISNTDFSDVTLTHEYLYDGYQKLPLKDGYSNSFYPISRTGDGWINKSSSASRFYKTPNLNIAGTQSGNAFTCTTKSDSYKFNGGDRVSGAGGSSFVTYVDYINGIIYVDGSTTGATTISQVEAYLIGYDLFGSGTPEGVVTANIGSKYTNISTGKLYVKESGTGNTGWVIK